MNVEDIVREGTVTAVDNEKRIAKVWFDALGIQSDWLPVLINRDRIGSSVETWKETQWTEYETCHVTHRHELVIKPYMPMVNDKVLVLYFPLFNADGVILGGIKPWK